MTKPLNLPVNRREAQPLLGQGILATGGQATAHLKRRTGVTQGDWWLVNLKLASDQQVNLVSNQQLAACNGSSASNYVDSMVNQQSAGLEWSGLVNN